MDKKMKLLCIPYAGGSAMMFDKWKKKYGDHVEVVPLELPGRGLRFREPVAGDMEELTDDLYARVQKMTDGEPYMLVGFCYGCIVAYALYQKMVRENYANLPAGLLVISSLPPGRHSKAERLMEMNNLTLVRALLGVFSFNPFRASREEMDVLKSLLEIVNPEVREELRSMNIFQLVLGFLLPVFSFSGNCQAVLKLMREDGQIMYHYDGLESDVKIRCPVYAIHGDTDNVVEMDVMRLWEEKCESGFELTEVSGGHLMIFDEGTDFEEEFLRILQAVQNNGNTASAEPMSV